MMAITVNYGQSKSIHIFSQPETLASCAIWAHSDTHNRMEHITPTNEAETHTRQRMIVVYSLVGFGRLFVLLPDR